MGYPNQSIENSSINKNLRKELDARALAGIQRDTNSIDYMVSKIASVKLIAYKNPNTAFDFTDTEKSILHVLGGREMLTRDYRTSDIITDNVTYSNEFEQATNKNKSYGLGHQAIIKHNQDLIKRTGPFIESIQTTIVDQSLGTINSATINISIPDPNRDLDLIEVVYMRLQRPITIIISQPNSVVLTGLELESNLIHSDHMGDTNTNTKMNEFIMNCFVVGYSFKFNSDGSVTATINLTGRTNLVTNVAVLATSGSVINDITDEINESNTDVVQNKAADLYTKIYKMIDYDFKNKYPNALLTKNEKQISYDGQFSELKSQNNENKIWSVVQTWNLEEIRYISLGALIEIINQEILQQSPIPGYIIADDSICTSKTVRELISLNPKLVWLRGQNGKYQTYGNSSDAMWVKSSKDASFNSYINIPTDPDMIYTSRIMINIERIRTILDELKNKNTSTVMLKHIPSNVTVEGFLKHVSSLIYSCTGNFIDMKLIDHPDDDSKLLYYDRDLHNGLPKFGSTAIQPYVVPMSVKIRDNNGKVKTTGTIVRSIEFTGKISRDLGQAAAASSAATNTSTTKTSEFFQFLFDAVDIDISRDANRGVQTVSVTESFKLKYKERYETVLKELYAAKTEYKNSPSNPAAIERFRLALLNYYKTPYPDVAKVLQYIGSTTEIEASFVIDGINGFRWGDTLEFPAFPSRYRKILMFTIKQIQHTVNAHGEWTTQISTYPKIKDFSEF